jgi:hypothetical protein
MNTDENPEVKSLTMREIFSELDEIYALQVGISLTIQAALKEEGGDNEELRGLLGVALHGSDYASIKISNLREEAYRQRGSMQAAMKNAPLPEA